MMMPADDAFFQQRWQALHHRQACRRDEQLFRAAQLQEVHLSNAAALWARHVATTQREVSEKAEALKTVAYLGALLASLALVAFLQFGYVYDSQQHWFSPAVQPLYAFFMATAIALEMSSVVLCSLELASVLRTGTGYISVEAEAEFMARARGFVDGYTHGDRPPAAPRSFAVHWRQRCERDWQLAFRLFAAGIPAFFCTMICSSWIKFATDDVSAAIATALLASGMVLCACLYWRWSGHLLEGTPGGDQDDDAPLLPPVEPNGLPFDWTLPPAPCRTCSGRTATGDTRGSLTSGRPTSAGGGEELLLWRVPPGSAPR